MIEEFEKILKEAYQSVEQSLALEDKGWVTLGGAGSNIIPDAERITAVQKARIYATKDPLARQAVRLWTDYTFGTGMNWSAKEDATTKAMSAFWDSPANAAILSPSGQRKSSDKLLIDGEIFFALFLKPGGEATIRRIDPLEITGIITDPDDLENVRFYKRSWSNTLGQQKEVYYRSFANQDNEPVKDSSGGEAKSSEEALVYHLAINTIGQRGNSMLLPAIDWIKLYRQFLASRVAIMLALARFAWKVKVQGGQTAVDAAKAVYQDKTPAAGSVQVENMGADMQPIRTDSGARNAYDDGRMIKLQVSAATGWPEQYFGDISIGNLATAKTVELPVMKMCQSYQATWSGAFADIDNLILEKAGVSEDKRYVDRDFPDISLEDALSLAQAIQGLTMAFPQFADSDDVMQRALMAIGVNNTSEVLDAMVKEAKGRNPNVALIKALREFKEAIGGLQSV